MERTMCDPQNFREYVYVALGLILTGQIGLLSYARIRAAQGVSQ